MKTRYPSLLLGPNFQPKSFGLTTDCSGYFVITVTVYLGLRCQAIRRSERGNLSANAPKFCVQLRKAETHLWDRVRGEVRSSRMEGKGGRV